MRGAAGIFVAAVFLASCGGGGGDGDAGPVRRWQRACEASCVLPADGPCATATQGDCVTHCVAWMEGLDDECAGCLFEYSDWGGFECVCETATRCNVCAFGPYGAQTCPGSEGFICTEVNESCSGFQLINTNDARCFSACGFGPDAGM